MCILWLARTFAVYEQKDQELFFFLRTNRDGFRNAIATGGRKRENGSEQNGPSFFDLGRASKRKQPVNTTMRDNSRSGPTGVRAVDPDGTEK